MSKEPCKNKVIIVYPDDINACYFTSAAFQDEVNLSPEKIFGFSCLATLDGCLFLTHTSLSNFEQTLAQFTDQIAEGLTLILCNLNADQLDLTDPNLPKNLNIVTSLKRGDKWCSGQK